jgi:hypothetical protein
MALFKIRFITESDPISDAIRLVTFSEWSHVEIITETGSYIGAHAKGGVQERPADYTKVSRERRYEIPVADDQYTKMMAFARSKIGTPYDFKDIAGLFLHKNLSSEGTEICSMFVFESALAGGLQMLNVLSEYSNLVTPETLHLSPYLIGKCVYSFPS